MYRLDARSDDPLSTMLRELSVRSTVFCLSQMGAPWGFAVEGSPVPKFHIVLDGCCQLDIRGAEPTPLVGGEIVVLPRGTGHTMRDGPESPVRDLNRILLDHPIDGAGHLAYGGGGPVTRLLCGGFQLADHRAAPLLEVLPRRLVLDAATCGLNRWLEPLFVMLQSETRQNAPGAAAVMGKLADVFLTQMLRIYLAGAAQTGVATDRIVTHDQLVTRAIGLLRHAPAAPWTLSSLAQRLDISRSLLSSRFRATTGQGPIRYLTRLRLSQAAGYLSTTDKPHQAIARMVGYANEAALAKAFKREFGRTPGAFRRQALATPIWQDGVGPAGGRRSGAS